MSPTPSRSVKSADTMFSIIESLRLRDGAGVTELSEELDIAKSTVHTHLKTLEQKQYVIKEDGVYHLGFKFLRLGEHARTRKEIYRMAEPIVEELAVETNERSQFIVEEYNKGVFVHRSTGTHAVQTDTGLGKRIYLHSTGAGKAILAHLPSDRIDAIIEDIGLPKQTENTITDPEELRDELEQTRERGYAFNREEGMSRLRTVGVPVMNQDGSVFGALSVSGPSYRMRGDVFNTEIPNMLLGKANEFELKIEFES